MFLLQQATENVHKPFFFDGWYDVRRTVILSIVGFIALIIMLRVSGKRTLSKLNVFDFVFVVACGSVFAASIVEKDVTLVEGVLSLATLIAFLFRFNKVAIYSGTFINNPFLTLVPIIIASYAVGAFILGRPLRIPAGGVELLRHPHLLTAAYYSKLFRESWDIVWPFTIGGLTLSVVCSLIAYPVTSSLLRARRRAKVAN